MLLVLQLNNLLGDPPVLVEVPDVVGQSQASATAELEGEGFGVVVITDYSSTVPAGNVISQIPLAGVEAVEGSNVTITVSLGEAPATNAAGKSRRKRYFVEIDGQSFLVDSETEARALLERARAIAERQAEVKAEKVVKVLRRKPAVPKVEIKVPEITVSPALLPDLKPMIADIERLYQKASETAELRLLLLKQMEDEDEAEAEMLLLL